MTVDALRTLAHGVLVATLGVPITIVRPVPEQAPIATTGVWLAEPLEEPRPVGVEFQRRDPRKVLAITRDTVLTHIPRGSTITAPELQGGAVVTWRVDGLVRVDVEEIRVIVVPLES